MKPMLVSLAAATAALVAVAARPARADVSIIDNDKTLEVDCAKDPQVTLIGNHITLTTKGVCQKITIDGNDASVVGSANVVFVAGNHNTVTLAAADDITVAGSNNVVKVAKAAKLKVPRIANSGTANQISQPR